MSCQVRVAASIVDINKIRKYLFPIYNQNGTDTSESWLQQCKISISQTGNLIVIANEGKIVVLTPKWDAQYSMNFFHIDYSESINEYDKIKAVMCLEVGGQNDISQVGSEWTCIVLGFESGYVRFYTENCDLVFEEQFSLENIDNITCRLQRNRSNSSHLEEVYIHYKSVICVLNGSQLISVLRTCHNLESDYNRDSLPLLPTKWGFQEQFIVNDSVVVGLNASNTFDHLLTASTSGGFNTKYRAMPPNSTLVMAVGSKPFLGYHYAIEGGGQPVLSDVAKAVASKLKSTLPSWLMGSKSSQEKQMSYAAQPADPMGCRFGICDLRRAATDIILSPDHKLAVVCDSLGRILLVDCFKGIVLKMFKGYREAQCSFIQVPDERRSKQKMGYKAHFLAIYSPKKGTIEIFAVQQGTRIALFSASKYSSLLYINYGCAGLTSSKSKSKCQYTTLFIDNDGSIKEFSIPFHVTPSDKSNKKARDVHLYKKFRHLLKTSQLENEALLNEALDASKEIKTNGIKFQLVELLLENRMVPVNISLECIQYFLDNIEGEDADNLERLCQRAKEMLNLFTFLNNPCTSQDQTVEEENKFALEMEVKEMANIRKLLDISNVNIPEVHVKFSDNSTCSASEFCSIFDYSADCITLKSNVDNNDMLKVSEMAFKNYIDGTSRNYNELKDKLTESNIPTKNLFDLLLNYWLNRSFNISSIIEDEIHTFSSILDVILNISKKDIYNTEFSEVSEFWSQVRNILTDSSKPFPALIAAILCKQLAQKFAKETQLDESGATVDDMEVLTQEDIEWTLLIGKLEDISLLNLILSTKPSTKDCPLPKLKYDKVEISLKHILQKGSGSVSELVAQWLTTIGINPEKIVLHESLTQSKEIGDDRVVDNDNAIKEETLFKNLELMRQQFPYSLQANVVITNMSWEYAAAWQRDVQDLSLLEACITCMKNVQSFQIKQGLHQLVWNTHLKIVNENVCKLINKVGKLPKERLCKQDIGLTDYQVSLFLRISTDFLDSFIEAVKTSLVIPKEKLNFENFWDCGEKSLVELAMEQKCVNFELLFLHHQLSLVLYMMSSFPIKYSKPINNLFEASAVNLFFTELQRKIQISFNKSDVRLNSSRNHFLCKIISASIESVTVNESGNIYSTDHVFWMSKCISLGKIWNLDINALRSYQLIQLYSGGFDSLAEELISAVNKSQELAKPLLKIATKRLSHFLVASPQLSENISALSPVLTKYIESLDEEWHAPTSLQNITLLSTHILQCLTEDDDEYHMASMFLDACKTLEDIKS